MNRVILMGRLTRDPQTKPTAGGTSVTEFAIAHEKKFKVDGEERKKVGYYDVTMFGRRGEVVAKYLKKGNRILIEGELDYQSWPDKETGAKRTKVCIFGTSFDFIESSRQRGEEEPGSSGVQEADEWNGTEPSFDGDNDVPF